MQRTTSYSRFGRPLLTATRGICTSTSKGGGNEKIVASVLFERLPVVIPKIDPVVYAFQEFSFRWRQQYRREYPEAFLKKADARGKGDYQIEYTPAPRITEADITNDKRSLQRALDRRLYLLIYGTAYGSNGAPVWHFPEKVYESEQTLRKCAESALKSVIGDLSHTYFVGNAPMGHVIVQPSENDKVDTSLQVSTLSLPATFLFIYVFLEFCKLVFGLWSLNAIYMVTHFDEIFQRFFFKSQVIATNKFNIGKCEDYVWVTKDELLEYFPEQAEYLNKMIIS